MVTGSSAPRRKADRGRYFCAMLMTLISDGARSMIFKPKKSALTRSHGLEEPVLDSCKFEGFIPNFGIYLPLSAVERGRNRLHLQEKANPAVTVRISSELRAKLAELKETHNLSLEARPESQLTGFCTTPNRRITVAYGGIMYGSRCCNPSLQRKSTRKKSRFRENRGSRPDF